jgi:hypothetical protein
MEVIASRAARSVGMGALMAAVPFDLAWLLNRPLTARQHA